MDPPHRRLNLRLVQNTMRCNVIARYSRPKFVRKAFTLQKVTFCKIGSPSALHHSQSFVCLSLRYENDIVVRPVSSPCLFKAIKRHKHGGRVGHAWVHQNETAGFFAVAMTIQ
jgi:hypothetical protein